MSSKRISVIIAAYNVENFIQQAIQSAVDQSPPFHEIIVVNDCSTDETPRLIDEMAQNQTNIRMITCPENCGLGAVRNLGTENATGDYIAYLDGDDLFTPEAHALMQQAIATDPDLAILNHSRLYINGRAVPNTMTNILSAGVHTTPKEKIALFENLNVAWNKVYKREFLQRTRLTFPVGKYEDIAWNYLALMYAGTIVTSPKVIVLYRQRDGSILRSKNDTHFDIFDRWDELFAALRADPVLWKTYADSLKLRRFRSLMHILDSRRLPDASKPRFAERIRQVCKPTENFSRPEVARSDLALGYRGGYYLRRVLRAKSLLRVRLGIRQAPVFARRVMEAVNLQLYRHVFLRLPIDRNLVVYESYWGKKIACNPYAIFKHLQNTAGDDYRHVWVVQPGKDLRETEGHAEHVKQNSLRYFYHLARAGYLINNANFPDFLVKRQGSIHVQTKHGTPLKYMGLDILTKDPGELVNPLEFARRCLRWDYVISSNPYSSRVWRLGFPYNYKMIETGYPRNDRLVAQRDVNQAEFRKKLGLPSDKRVVLYAPTFRPEYPRVEAAGQPNKEQIVTAIMKGLDEDCVLAIRDHYFLSASSAWAKDPRIVDLSAHDSTNDVLLATDLLITDYSSIMFDFAVLKRPIVVLGYDKALYEQARGMYFDISEEHPGVYCDDLDQLTEALRRRTYESTIARKSLDAFHEKFCPWEDGNASVRVCDVVFNNAG